MPSRLRIAAIASFSTLALMAGTTATAYADANPLNRGHHYGQLKHPKVSPSPSPSPAPNQSGTPASTPAQSVHPSVTFTVATPAPISISISVGAIAAPVAGGVIEPVAALPDLPGNEDDWLLLLILPSLLAVWLIAAVGLARRIARIGKKTLVPARVPA